MSTTVTTQILLSADTLANIALASLGDGEPAFATDAQVLIIGYGGVQYVIGPSSSGSGAPGPPGPPGQPGATWSQGKGPPSQLLGNTGDFYLNASSGDIWQKQRAYDLAVPAWVLVCSPTKGLTGPQGIPGLPGPPGPQGLPGLIGAGQLLAYLPTPADESTSSTSFVDLTTQELLTITLPVQRTLIVLYLTNIYAPGGSGGSAVEDGLFLDGVQQTTNWSTVPSNAATTWIVAAAEAAVLVNVAAGTHTIAVQHKVDGAFTGHWRQRALLIFGG